jgi:hypothetical protein
VKQKKTSRDDAKRAAAERLLEFVRPIADNLIAIEELVERDRSVLGLLEELAPFTEEPVNVTLAWKNFAESLDRIARGTM